jgi:hypothetical protein
MPGGRGEEKEEEDGGVVMPHRDPKRLDPGRVSLSVAVRRQ